MEKKTCLRTVLNREKRGIWVNSWFNNSKGDYKMVTVSYTNFIEWMIVTSCSTSPVN